MSETILDDTYVLEENGQIAFPDEPEHSATIKDYYWINQSREIINSQQDLTLMERRLIFSLVSLIQPDDDEFKTYTIQIKDLANLLGVAEKSFYERVEKTVDQLQSKQLIVENEKVLKKITWVQSATYVKGEGRVIIKLSEDLAPFFRNLKRAYTKYRLKNVLMMKSEYSWRLYEILKEREFRKERILRIADIRYLMNIPEDKYKMLKHLRELLDAAQKEIDEKTDITFTYDVHKKIGRSVDSFIFKISNNTKNNQTEADSASYDAERLLHLLAEHGVHRKKASQLIKKFHPFYIEENVRQALSINGNDSIRNVAGFIVKAIEDNYANSNWDTPNDDALFNMELRNVEQRLEDATAADIESLKNVLRTYHDLINREAANANIKDVDDLNRLGKERDEMILKHFDTIQRKRKMSHMPPLHYDDLQDSLLKRAYESWEVAQTYY
ncbi:replication initiation protein [Cohnella soli]|uniref:Replication initiation protein n=1 Tax=Cohnella soli TaxID=425005 RepID=A0ABW0HMU3_9BACL